MSLCTCRFTIRIKTNKYNLYTNKFCVFQEAHKMVREANVKQANAEKQLKEALGKVTLNTHTLQTFLSSLRSC